VSDHAYVRTTKSRNKVNQRRYRPFTPAEGHEVTSDGKAYVVAPDGARVRVKRAGER
jgi:hypothetical protein